IVAEAEEVEVKGERGAGCEGGEIDVEVDGLAESEGGQGDLGGVEQLAGGLNVEEGVAVGEDWGKDGGVGGGIEEGDFEGIEGAIGSGEEVGFEGDGEVGGVGVGGEGLRRV